jgi:hypothetical protein
MSDVVQRLRNVPPGFNTVNVRLSLEAADEIERLEKETAQMRADAESHIDLIERVKDHMDRMNFNTREEEPYFEEMQAAIDKARGAK